MANLRIFGLDLEIPLLLIRVVATLASAFVLSRVARFAVRRFERRLLAKDEEYPGQDSVKRARTLGTVIYTLARVIIWGVAVVATISTLAPGLKTTLAGFGLAGAALALSAKDIGGDLFSGFYILLERQYDVGDIVSVAGVSGVVESISLRTTILRDLDGQRHVVPNGEIRVSSNYTKGFSRYLFDLPVGYDQDIDEAVAVASRVTDEMREEEAYRRFFLGPLFVLGVDEYADSWVNVKVYVETTPGQQFAIGRELRRRIKIAWEAEGIQLPYPHQVFVSQTTDPGTLDGHSSHSNGSAARPPAPAGNGRQEEEPADGSGQRALRSRRDR